MENKNLKTSVFSFDTVFSESAECPVDIDFTLPEYYADISKILKCRAVSRISSKNARGNNIAIEGQVTVTIIYCGNDKSINSYEYQYPFSKNFDTGFNTDDCILNAKTKCEYINCRAVTSKKIDIHGAVGIYVNLSRRNITNVVSDCDQGNIELLRGSVPATIPLGIADKYLLIDEEIELGAAQPDIRCIVRYDADVTVTDSKIIAGKSMVKGEMQVKVLYAPEGNMPLQTVRYQLPFSQFIELEGISEECECESQVSISHMEIKPRVSASGDCRHLILNAKLLVTSTCCCNNEVAIIIDAYSRKHEANIIKNEVCFNQIVENVHQNFTCKQAFDFAECGVSSIVDMWCEPRVNTVKFCDNAMRVCGTVTIFIISLDSESTPMFYEKTIDFEYTYPINLDGEYNCLPKITVTAVNYVLTGENAIEFRVELNICGTIYRCSKLPLITEIEVNAQNKVQSARSSAMTIYFALKGETIWDISRRYLASPEEIKQINDIAEEILTTDTMILIPNI